MRSKSILTYIFGLFLIPLLGLAMSGCGNSTTDTSQAANQNGESGFETAEILEGTETPELVVRHFLETLYRNQQEESLRYLSNRAKKARKEHARREGSVMFFEPPVSRDASFKVVKVDMTGKETAQVETILTDYDIDGYENTDPPIFWSVKKTPQGWRIAGAAVVQYEGMPPIVVNLEDIQATERAVEMAYRQHEQWESEQERLMQQRVRQGNIAPGPVVGASYNEYDVPMQNIPAYEGNYRDNFEASSRNEQQPYRR